MNIKVIFRNIPIILVMCITVYIGTSLVYGNTQIIHVQEKYETNNLIGTNELVEEDVQANNISPATENNIKDVLATPVESLVFYGGIVIILSIVLLILILINNRKK